MTTLLSFLTSLCSAAIHQAFPELEELTLDITPSTKEHFGHYQCNDAMKLARVLRKSPLPLPNRSLRIFLPLLFPL